MSVVIYIFIALLILFLGVSVYLWYSVRPAVWLLRHGGDGPAGVPEGFEEQVKAVVVQKDMVYPSAYGKNRFDLYLPDSETKAPLILWVHGGAFVAGDKSGLNSWGKLLASHGYAVAAMNYEWAPEAVWPAQVVQAAECLKELIRLSKESLPIDSSRIFLAGDSAGAHIAIQAATAWFNETFSEETGISMPLSKEDKAIKGLLLYCGPYDPDSFSQIKDGTLRYFMNKVGQSYLGTYRWKDSEKAKYLNAASWITKDCPPVYLTDGNAGSFERQGRNLGRKLKALGVPVTERYFESQAGQIPHEYQMDLVKPEAVLCFEDTLQFLKDNRL